MFVFSVHFNQSLSSVAFLFIYLAVSGLSCGTQALDCWLSSCSAQVAPPHVESRDPSCVYCIGKWILNHWGSLLMHSFLFSFTYSGSNALNFYLTLDD